MTQLNEFAEQLEEIRQNVENKRTPRRTSMQLIGMLGAIVEELNITIEELGLQNEELHLATHLQGMEVKRYHEMFLLAPIAQLTTDPLGVIVEANAEAAKLLNVGSSMLEGKPLSVYIQQSDRRAFRRLLQNVADYDMGQVIEITLQPRGRMPIVTEVSVRAVPGTAGDTMMLSWMLRDVTVRDRHLREIRAMNAVLEQRIAEEAAKLDEALSARDAAVARESTAHWIAESSTRRLEFLAEAGETLAEAADAGGVLSLLLSCMVPTLADWGVIALVEDEGSLVEALVAHENKERDWKLKGMIGSDDFRPRSMLCCAGQVVATGLPHSMAKGEAYAAQFDVPTAFDWFTVSNPMKFSILSIPLRSRGKMLGVLELGRGPVWAPFDSDDLTYTMALAGRSTAAFDSARLVEQTRVAAVARDQFLALAAHELRTPITIFRGYAQILERQLAAGRSFDGPRAHRMARAIEDQADRMTALIEQLLDVSRLDSGQLGLVTDEIDVSALIASQVEVAQATTERHQFDASIVPGVRARADRIRFTQVVSHLFDNAIKFSLDGGTIEVNLELPGDDTIRLSVTDRGIGIEPAHREHIFDRFYLGHSHADIRGLGLGLSVSREIMRLHGGDLRVEFPSDSMTRFVAELPRVGSTTEPTLETGS